MLTFSGKIQYSSARHLIEMDSDPYLDRQALDVDPDYPKMMPIRPDPDPVNLM
jgi:hypothetical protein